MPRKRRLFIPDLPQHVVQRGVDRQPVFFSDSDCARYLNTFSEYAERRNISLHAYCLMTNHTHLLVSAKEKGALSACMQELGLHLPGGHAEVDNTVGRGHGLAGSPARE